ncbi:spidroin-1-like [Drosophila subpulchrella]|uniref:spidroin-1-like n=1 Tax=Drosophila subpulchrella TaxID=1486046 RepID=UPI0018A1A45C|nr:spidroin-1-like [Drosophila subpulchrella]
MKLLIVLFALMGVILAAPQGFVGVHVVPGDIPALHSAGKLRVQEGREDLKDEHLEYRIGFNSEGGFGSQGVYGVSSPDVGGQSGRFNLESSGVPEGMDGYSGAGPQVAGQREELKDEHPKYQIGLNSGGGFGSQGVYGVSSPDVGDQSERFNPGSWGVFAGMDGYNGADPQFVGQREELKDEHPEYPIGINSGGGFGSQGAYGVSSPDVGVQSERFNPGSSGVFAGMDGFNGAGPQFVGQREELKNGHPEYPIGFNSGGGFGSQGVYGVSSPDVGGQSERFNPGSWGVFASRDGYNGVDPQFVGQRKELKDEHPEYQMGFNSGGGFGGQGVNGVSSPDVGGQSGKCNPGSWGVFAGMDRYNGADPQFVGQREELKDEHPEYPIGFNSGGGFGSQGAYGVSSPDVGGQSGRFNPGSWGVFAGMDGYNGADPQFVGQREELKNGHPEYPIGFNSGGGFGSQGVYGVSSPDVGGQSERFNPGSWGVFASMDGYNGADPQFVGQRKELKDKHPEYQIGFNSGGGFGGQGVYGVSSPDVGGQSGRFNPGSWGVFAGMDGYNGADPQFVGQREEIKDEHPEYQIGFNSGGGFGGQGVYGVSSPDVGGQSERFNLANLGGKSQTLNSGRVGLDNRGAYGVAGPNVGGESERFKGFSNGEGVDGHVGAHLVNNVLFGLELTANL